MQVNLNDSKEFTFDNVCRLLASGHNDQFVQIRVSMDGIAYLWQDTGPDDKAGVAFRFETMDPGNDFIGPAALAARDPVCAAQVFNCLKKNWPKPTALSVDVEPYGA